MALFTKDQIIDEIRRTATANGGEALGRHRFEKETGIRPADWNRHWARFSDAILDAGFQPNCLQRPRDENDLLECLSRLAREIGRFPVSTEVDLRARSEKGFPWYVTFRQRFGSTDTLAKRLREFALERDRGDIVAMCDAKIANSANTTGNSDNAGEESDATIGYVYMLKSGRYYKIGRSNAAGRRERELQIQLPEKAEIVHEIKTDDPIGIERYWHNRFAELRKNGEWFDLSAKDVAAFKRRKFQ